MRRHVLIFIVILSFLATFQTVQAQNSPIGTFDGVDNASCQVMGWAKDPDTTNSILIHIYKDGPYPTGTHIVSTTADLYRADLPYADKNHGFSYKFPSSVGLYDGKDHIIYIYGIDATGDLNVLLNLNPKTIQCPQKIQIDTGQPYIIGAWYFTGWFSDIRSAQWCKDMPVYGWRDDWCGVRAHALGADPFGLNADYSSREPLLGFYDLMDQRMMDTHILQAASRGLSYFAFYWYWQSNNSAEMDSSLPLHKFVSSVNKDKIKFIIAPMVFNGEAENLAVSIDEWKNKIVPYMVDNFILDASYLKTSDGRPVIAFWTHFQDIATHIEAIRILKEQVRQKVGKEPVVLIPNYYDSSLINAGADGFLSFNVGPEQPAEPYSQTLSGWLLFFAKQNFTTHIPCASVGFDPRPGFTGWCYPGTSCTPFVNLLHYNTGITTEAFENHLKDVKQYLDQNSEKTAKMLTIYAWNEWSEGGIVEPGKKQGYLYLNIIQKVFGLSSKAPAPDIPPDISPPSIPAGLQAESISLSQINLSWKSSIDNFNVSGYEIYRNGTQIATVIPSSRNPMLRWNYVESGLLPGKTYNYAISSYDDAGNPSPKSEHLLVNPLGLRSDLNKDGSIGFPEFDNLKYYWKSASKPNADINEDGIVDSVDLGLVMSYWNSHYPMGTFDTVYNETCQILGWTKDPDTTSPIVIHIYKDGVYGVGTIVGATAADAYREDLPFTDKKHGFSYKFLSSSGLYDGNDHPIYIYGIDGTGNGNVLLDKTPQTIRCPIIT